ncbi:MAG: acyl-CoA dehydratase activase-related protein [Bacteroidales bacterium]|jgi:predicted CoA-substrate-specific enzyme activase|nr:acyl-CoA dehydratase activase-related protein [Bacteroidales bacterium]
MTQSNKYGIGIDIGSTTLKIIVLNVDGEIVHKVYVRHKAEVNTVLNDELGKVFGHFEGASFGIAITGSVGMGLAERSELPFVQEVVAAINVIRQKYSSAQTMIDIGGEDAKIVFFERGKQPDIRMNGSCAGGTGAFIDQMADLLNISADALGEKALQYEKIYPVASRCGVFAKTDVQNLIAGDVPVADIAMSVLYTVALQTITALMRGNESKPQVLCVGGPLTFLPALRNAFKQVMKIEDKDFILPENSEFFPAWGCAIASLDNNLTLSKEELTKHLLIKTKEAFNTSLSPLFNSKEEYEQWKQNRNIKKLKSRTLEPNETLRCYLGIDAGSTTTKILIIDDDYNIVFSYYTSNQGNHLGKVAEGMALFHKEIKAKNIDCNFISSASTGYGEDLIRTAFDLDFGIVETMAHLRGAQYVNPNVSFVLDIGGQDMKSIFTSNGVISNIELNEACSSGCGSFLQNFASTMNLSLDAFTQEAALAEYPADLGTRCTVFMNSKVKQSLRENASIGDIAAGLAYSVVKNCLFKVLKIANLNMLGDNIVVQGGTFKNDAVYRALELLSEKSVSSTDHPELMGAFGAALYAKSANSSSVVRKEISADINNIDKTELNCSGCNNKCHITKFTFANGNVCYNGNKCEKIFSSKASAQTKGYNAFISKYDAIFNRSAEQNPRPRGSIGIPRVLNMYENYPFWHTLFTECGFDVILSPHSSTELYKTGVGSVMSENICFPAKVVHGHIMALIKYNVERIFYPIIPKETKDFDSSSNSFNCPVVSGYPEVIRSAINPAKYGIKFDKPVINFNDTEVLRKGCYAYLSELMVDKKTFARAFAKALRIKDTYKHSFVKEQKLILNNALKKDKELVFIVSGRPYHADPFIHQQVGQILSGLGVHALSDDVLLEGDKKGFSNLNMVSQWSYPNRVVSTAMAVADMPANVQMLQLNSFGCGPDSFFMEETGNILKHSGKNYTVLRIDEIASPGSIRLRLRSLIESLKSADTSIHTASVKYEGYTATFKEEDRKRTILIPWFSDFISPFIPKLAEIAGYKFINVPKTSKQSADIGLKYGNNEVCYPATLVLGDVIAALQSGQYNLKNVAIAITQTGGQCRATNYLSQIKQGLHNAGFDNIPVISVSLGGTVYQNEQDFKIPFFKLFNIGVYTLLFADAIEQMYASSVAREKIKGTSLALFDRYISKAVAVVTQRKPKLLFEILTQAVEDFNKIEVSGEPQKVGFIGEIFLKYNNYGQAHIGQWLQEHKIEVVTPPMIDFLLQAFVNSKVNAYQGTKNTSRLSLHITSLFYKIISRKIKRIERIHRRYRYFSPNESIFRKAKYASEILDLSNQFGEGWAIAGEVAFFAHHNINKVVCVQPFGCIANHIVAKGIERRIKTRYPKMNILFLDIDNGSAEVNLQNRLHFLIK